MSSKIIKKYITILQVLKIQGFTNEKIFKKNGKINFVQETVSGIIPKSREEKKFYKIKRFCLYQHCDYGIIPADGV
jgi:hypothetical protein